MRFWFIYDLRGAFLWNQAVTTIHLGMNFDNNVEVLGDTSLIDIVIIIFLFSTPTMNLLVGFFPFSLFGYLEFFIEQN